MRGEPEGWLRTLDADAAGCGCPAGEQVTLAVLLQSRVPRCLHVFFRAGATEGKTPVPEEERYRRSIPDLERTMLTIIKRIRERRLTALRRWNGLCAQVSAGPDMGCAGRI